jgi:hypothetical protein
VGSNRTSSSATMSYFLLKSTASAASFWERAEGQVHGVCLLSLLYWPTDACAQSLCTELVPDISDIFQCSAAGTNAHCSKNSAQSFGTAASGLDLSARKGLIPGSESRQHAEIVRHKLLPRLECIGYILSEYSLS